MHPLWATPRLWNPSSGKLSFRLAVHVLLVDCNHLPPLRYNICALPQTGGQPGGRNSCLLQAGGAARGDSGPGKSECWVACGYNGPHLVTGEAVLRAHPLAHALERLGLTTRFPS